MFEYGIGNRIVRWLVQGKGSYLKLEDNCEGITLLGYVLLDTGEYFWVAHFILNKVLRGCSFPIYTRTQVIDTSELTEELRQWVEEQEKALGH